MVQEIAQKIIATAKEKKAQDIYFIPKEKSYELHMRVGDERCLVDSYEFDVLAAVISHFKFVAGYERRREEAQSAGFLRLSAWGEEVFSAFVYRRRLSGA